VVLAESLALLGVDAVDLWLIHWPPADSTRMWRALLDARERRLVIDVGVSNYSLAQLDELEAATGVMPAVNQIPWSPLLFDREVLEGHRERGVVLEGYSGLRGGAITHPVVVDVAGQVGRSPAQVVIRWHLQHGVVVIPKSSSPERIAANADIGGFQLDDAQMASLDGVRE
jgi:diketogulonate reductase-like aldo/keto reductase